MSTSDSTIKGKVDELVGKAKQAFGDATGDDSVANKGAAQEVKGHGEQAWGSVKEAAHDSTANTRTESETRASNTGHDLRDSVTSTAENVKNHIKNAADDLKR